MNEFLMKIYKYKMFNKPSFFSEEMVITKKLLTENHLKLTYQKDLISNLDLKHKEWSKKINY